MRIPIKLNNFRFKIKLPGVIEDPRILINENIDDGDFEKVIGFFKIDQTMKITEKNRQPMTDKYLIKLLEHETQLSILEVGSSCGVNSLNLINEVSDSLKKFFITDLFMSLPFVKKDNFTFFYNPKTEKCIMAVSDYFAFYSPTKIKIPFLNRISE